MKNYIDTWVNNPEQSKSVREHLKEELGREPTDEELTAECKSLVAEYFAKKNRLTLT